MKVTKLQFENFRSFNHNQVELPDHPIVVIYDENGQGKTSIQEGILWALAGEIYRYNRDDLKSEYGTIDALYNLRADKKSRIQLRLEMEDDEGNKVVTKINRPVRRKTYLTPSLDNDLQYSINEKNVSESEFYEIMENMLHFDPRQFQNTNFLSQEIINEALVIDENIRANVFSQLLSFDWMQDINTSISEEIKVLRRIKRNVAHQKDKLEDTLKETEINQLWGDLQNKAKEMENNGLQLEKQGKIQIRDYLKRLYDAYKLLEDEGHQELLKEYLDEKQKTEDIGIQDLKDMHQDIKNQVKKLETKTGKLSSKMEISDKEIQNIEKSVGDYKSAKSELEETSTEIGKQVDKRKEAEKENKETNGQLEKVTKEKNELEKIDIKLDALVKPRDEIKTNFGSEKKIEENSSTITKKIEDIKQVEAKLKGNQKIITENIDTLKSIQDDIQSLNTEINQMSNNQTKSEVVDDIRKVLIDLESRVDNLEKEHENDLIKKLENLSTQIDGEFDDIDTVKVVERINTIITILSSIPKQSIIADLRDSKRDYENNQSKINRIPQMVELSETYSDDLKAKEAVLKTATDKKQKFKVPEDTGKLLLPSQLGLGLFGIIFLILGMNVSGGLAIIFFGLTTLTLIGLLLLFVPAIWVKQTHMDSSLSKFIAESTFKQMNEKDKETNELKIQELRDQISQIKKDKLDLEGQIDELSTIKKNLGATDIEIVQTKYDTYSSLDQLQEKFEISNQALKKVNSLDLNRINLDKLKKKSEDEDKKIRKELKEIDDIDFTLDFDTILGLLKSKALELSNKNNEYKDDLKELEIKKSELVKLDKAIEKIEKTITETYEIKPENLEEQIENLKGQIIELDTQIKKEKEGIDKIKTGIGELRDKEATINSNITSLKNYLTKQFVVLDLEEGLLEKEAEKINKEVKKKLGNIGDDKQTLDNKISKTEKISKELDSLDEYYTNLSLLQERWQERRVEIRTCENKIEHLQTKFDNLEELEKAWKVVSDNMQDTTENISDAILQVIKNDVLEYFDDLGGHRDLGYVDLEIKVIRNKLSVSINVGMDKELTGSPKVLFSNGQQVSLILAIFFAMSKQILKKSKLKWIGLDEPTQYLDTNRKADFVDFIHVFSEQHPELQLLITTADKEFVEMLNGKTEEIFHITNLKGVISSEFSDIKNIQDTPLPTSRKNGKKGGKLEVNLPGLDPNPSIEYDLPEDTEEEPELVGSIAIIDDMPLKELTCANCRTKFEAPTYQATCNNSECIRAYKSTMLNL